MFNKKIRTKICLWSWKSSCVWRRRKESFPQLTNTDSLVVSMRIFTHTRTLNKISAWNLARGRETSCRLPRTQSPVLFQQVSPFSTCSRTRASSNGAQTVRGTHVALENQKQFHWHLRHQLTFTTVLLITTAPRICETLHHEYIRI